MTSKKLDGSLNIFGDSNSGKTDGQKYQAVRICPGDYEEFRRYAYEERNQLQKSYLKH